MARKRKTEAEKTEYTIKHLANRMTEDLEYRLGQETNEAIRDAIRAILEKRERARS